MLMVVQRWVDELTKGCVDEMEMEERVGSCEVQRDGMERRREDQDEGWTGSFIAGLQGA